MCKYQGGSSFKQLFFKLLSFQGIGCAHISNSQGRCRQLDAGETHQGGGSDQTAGNKTWLEIKTLQNFKIKREPQIGPEKQTHKATRPSNDTVMREMEICFILLTYTLKSFNHVSGRFSFLYFSTGLILGDMKHVTLQLTFSPLFLSQSLAQSCVAVNIL